MGSTFRAASNWGPLTLGAPHASGLIASTRERTWRISGRLCTISIPGGWAYRKLLCLLIMALALTIYPHVVIVKPFTLPTEYTATTVLLWVPVQEPPCRICSKFRLLSHRRVDQRPTRPMIHEESKVELRISFVRIRPRPINHKSDETVRPQYLASARRRG